MCVSIQDEHCLEGYSHTKTHHFKESYSLPTSLHQSLSHSLTLTHTGRALGDGANTPSLTHTHTGRALQRGVPTGARKGVEASHVHELLGASASGQAAASQGPFLLFLCFQIKKAAFPTLSSE